MFQDFPVPADLGFNITRLDTGFMRFGMAACYLVESEGEYAIIETGTNTTARYILNHLDTHGISKESVRYVIPTHVHLDHAGGVGLLMQELPAAELLIHPRGSRHMIDTARLQQGAIDVYGESVFHETYGELINVDQSRVREMPDMSEVALGRRTFQFIDTPGHAAHHFCVFDSESTGIFTGDTAGISYPELTGENGNPFIIATTTPVQFDPVAMKASIKRLVAMNPKYFYLTHYGPVKVTDGLVSDLLEGIDQLVHIAQKNWEKTQDSMQSSDELANNIRNDIVQLWQTQHGDKALVKQCLSSDAQLNAQGLTVWLKRIQSQG